jgi:hypothetical protein
MSGKKENQEISVLGRLFSLEMFLFLMGMVCLVSGVITGELIQLFWGVMISVGSVILHFVRKKDWKKHWEDLEQQRQLYEASIADPDPRVSGDGPVKILERPLRAQTAQGERISLARSEMIPAGSTLRFKLRIRGGVSEALLREWLDFGELSGLGQWRGASFGIFSYTLSLD